MSVAKQFTNVLALSLVERGALRLHAPIAEWLPAFRAMGHEKVNLSHLLTHTSGICSAIPNLPPEVVGNIEQLTAYAASRPLESQPGERVNYSILVGHSVIAALCLAADGRGRTYSQMLEQEIFAPLKMRDSSLGLRKDLDARFCPVKAAWTRQRSHSARSGRGHESFSADAGRRNSGRRMRHLDCAICIASPRCCGAAANWTARGFSRRR